MYETETDRAAVGVPRPLKTWFARATDRHSATTESEPGTAATRVHLEYQVKRVRREDKLCMISLPCGIFKTKQNRKRLLDTENMLNSSLK